MFNKYILLFTRETRFGLRVAVLSVMIFAVVFSWNSVKTGRAELQKAEETQQLVASIPQMENEINDLETAQKSRLKQAAATAHTADPIPVINGILIKDNEPLVLAGDSFLKEGDSIGNNIIYKITAHKVVLRDKLTSLNREVNF